MTRAPERLHLPPAAIRELARFIARRVIVKKLPKRQPAR